MHVFHVQRFDRRHIVGAVRFKLLTAAAGHPPRRRGPLVGGDRRARERVAESRPTLRRPVSDEPQPPVHRPHPAGQIVYRQRRRGRVLVHSLGRSPVRPGVHLVPAGVEQRAHHVSGRSDRTQLGSVRRQRRHPHERRVGGQHPSLCRAHADAEARVRPRSHRCGHGIQGRRRRVGVVEHIFDQRGQALGVHAGAVEMGLRNHRVVVQDGHATGGGCGFEGEKNHERGMEVREARFGQGLLHHEAAVHDQVLPCDGPGPRGREEEHRVGHLLRGSHRAARGVLADGVEHGIRRGRAGIRLVEQTARH